MFKKLIFMLAALGVWIPAAAQVGSSSTAPSAASDRGAVDFYITLSRLSVTAFEVSQQYAYESGEVKKSEKETEKTKAQLAKWYGPTVEAARRLGALDQLKALRACELALLSDGVPRPQEMRYRWEARMQALKTKHESAISVLEAELESR
jgi:hypothetical protein